MSTSASTTSSLHFGPEWMRNTIPPKPRMQNSITPPPQPMSVPAANSYSSLLTPPLAAPLVNQDETHPFRYSKDQLLNIWKEGGGRGPLGLEVERWDGVVRDYPAEPISTKEMTEGEAKLFAMPLNSRRQSFSHDLAISSPVGSLGKFSGSPSSPMRERFGRRGDSTNASTGGSFSRPRQPSLSLASPPAKGDALPSPRPRLTGGAAISGFDGVLGGSLGRKKSSISFTGNQQESEAKGPGNIDTGTALPDGDIHSTNKSTDLGLSPSQPPPLDDSDPAKPSVVRADPEEAKRSTARAAALKDPTDILWTYIDPSGQLQGPFPGSSMQVWHDAFYFDVSLKTKRPNIDEEFLTVGDWVRRAGDEKVFLTTHTPVFATPTPPLPPPGLPPPLTHPARANSPSASSSSSSSALPSNRTEPSAGISKSAPVLVNRSSWPNDPGAPAAQTSDESPGDPEPKVNALEKQNLSERLQTQARQAQERHQLTLHAISGAPDPVHHPHSRSATFESLAPGSASSSSPASSFVADQSYAPRHQEASLEQPYPSMHSPSPYPNRSHSLGYDNGIADVNTAFRNRAVDQPYPGPRPGLAQYAPELSTSSFSPRTASTGFGSVQRAFDPIAPTLNPRSSIDLGNNFGLPFSSTFSAVGSSAAPSFNPQNQGYGALRTASPSFTPSFNSPGGNYSLSGGIGISPFEPSPFNGSGSFGNNGAFEATGSPSGFGSITAPIRSGQTPSLNSQRDDVHRPVLRATPEAFNNGFSPSPGNGALNHGLGISLPQPNQSHARSFSVQQTLSNTNTNTPPQTTSLNGHFVSGLHPVSSSWSNAPPTSTLPANVIFGPSFPKTTNLNPSLAQISDTSPWQNSSSVHTPSGTKGEVTWQGSQNPITPAPSIRTEESPWVNQQDKEVLTYRTLASGWGNVDEPVPPPPLAISQAGIQLKQTKQKGSNNDVNRDISEPIGTRSKKQANAESVAHVSKRRSVLQPVTTSSDTSTPVSSTAITPSPIPAPKAAWATGNNILDEDSKHSLREIQESEAARKADARKASLDREKNAVPRTTATPTTVEDSPIFSTSWGLPTSQAGTARIPLKDPLPSSSALAAPSSQAPIVWSTSPIVTQGKKTMKEIQEEEERRKKDSMKEKETAAAAAKRAYAETANKSTLLQQSVPGSAWTMVGANGKTTAAVLSPPGPRAPSLQLPQTSVLPLAQPRSTTTVTSTPTATRPVTGLPANSGSSRAATASPQQAKQPSLKNADEPPTPSPEFIRWLREALKGLNNVNLDDFIQLLLTFPLDPSPAVMETISDTIYSNSSTLDGRRFAADFCARRKVDATTRASTNRASGSSTTRGTSLADVVKTQPKPPSSEWNYRVVKKKGKTVRG